jgi:hypothetical protein
MMGKLKEVTYQKLLSTHIKNLPQTPILLKIYLSICIYILQHP